MSMEDVYRKKTNFSLDRVSKMWRFGLNADALNNHSLKVPVTIFGRGPDRRQSPVDWGEIPSVRLSIHPSICPPQLALRFLWLALTPLWLALTPLWQALRPL